jgi:hypothetical protein
MVEPEEARLTQGKFQDALDAYQQSLNRQIQHRLAARFDCVAL